MIRSQKDRGNDFFKSGKFAQAIKHYRNYVEDQHQDNKNAFFNLSLCYSKLGRRRESVEAAERAVALDKDYTKCYYRLALENKELGKHYEVFINAAAFLKLAPKNQIPQREEMAKLQTQYKSKLLTQKPQKWNNLQEIITQTEKLANPRQSRVEVDKEITQWLTEWNHATQNMQAILLEIRYIMEQIDYQYGLNVAFFYLNQLSNREQRERVTKEIHAMRVELNREGGDLQIEQSVLEVGKIDDQSDDQNLFQTDEKSQDKMEPKSFGVRTKEEKQNGDFAFTQAKAAQKLQGANTKPANEPKSASDSAISAKNDNLSSNVQPKKSPKQLLQELLKNKQKLQQHFADKDITMNIKSNPQTKQPQQPQTKDRPTPKPKKQSEHRHSCCSHDHEGHQSESTPITRESIVQQLKSLSGNTLSMDSDKVRTEEPKPQKQPLPHKPQLPQKQPLNANTANLQKQPPNANLDIQSAYNQYCGWLTSEKNKFAATFKCVLKILQSDQLTSLRKGQLLVTLKKRVKNFVVIMRSNSQNEQKVLYNLLTRHGIQQYAVDIAPLFYTP